MPTNKYELPVEKLRKIVNPEGLGFNSTCDLEKCADIVGQKRAMDALKLGLEISSTGYNIFVTGYVGTGRTTAVKCLLDDLEKDKKTPDDILYVNNFSDPDSPRLIRLSPGKGIKFSKAMDEYIEYLNTKPIKPVKTSWLSHSKNNQQLLHGNSKRNCKLKVLVWCRFYRSGVRNWSILLINSSSAF
jgi:ATP-dependent Lon protease